MVCWSSGDYICPDCWQARFDSCLNPIFQTYTDLFVESGQSSFFNYELLQKESAFPIAQLAQLFVESGQSSLLNYELFEKESAFPVAWLAQLYGNIQHSTHRIDDSANQRFPNPVICVELSSGWSHPPTHVPVMEQHWHRQADHSTHSKSLTSWCQWLERTVRTLLGVSSTI
uniref:Uncharacterized protein n=1 Tax=Romanomermis culicivorax TaxID=13658 RepID=A0A915IHC6_ROMCU